MLLSSRSLSSAAFWGGTMNVKSANASTLRVFPQAIGDKSPSCCSSDDCVFSSVKARAEPDERMEPAVYRATVFTPTVISPGWKSLMKMFWKLMSFSIWL